MLEKSTMRAVVFNGPWQIDVEERPKPVILNSTDAIVKVSLAGVCGSELHMYRGHQKTDTGHIMVRSLMPKYPTVFCINALAGS